MRETKTIFRLFWAWEFEKEERWLNEMALAGWALCKTGFCCYTFEKSMPGEYLIRFELAPSGSDYDSFVEETGAECVGHMLTWHYFRRKASLGSFDLYSDLDSRIAHLDRIGRVLLAVGTANLCIGIVNSINPVHIGWVNLLCSTLIMYGLGRIHGKKEHLTAARMLQE